MGIIDSLPVYDGELVLGCCCVLYVLDKGDAPHSKNKCCYFHTKINTFWLQLLNMFLSIYEYPLKHVEGLV